MKGVIAYVLSKKYTDDSLIGMGALKGANCKVKDVVKTDRTTTVTLSWKDDLDVEHDTDFEILDGLDGVDVVSATISNTYHLILTLSDGNTIDAGVISDKVTTMPTASSSNVGMINQFVGTTDSNYTHGYFYECIENEDVYSWQRIDVQPNIIESVNGQTGIVTLTAEDVGALPEDTVIPTKTSELTNDSNFVDEDDLTTKQDIIQYETLPTASETLVGKIFQYIGNTTLNYHNGYFYQCVEDEVEEGQPQTYSWIAKSVQQGGGSGTSDYEELQNLPKVNNVILVGNKSLSDLSIYSKEEVNDLLEDKQDSLPTVINGKFLHTNEITGDFEWIDIDFSTRLFDSSLTEAQILTFITQNVGKEISGFFFNSDINAYCSFSGLYMSKTTSGTEVHYGYCTIRGIHETEYLIDYRIDWEDSEDWYKVEIVTSNDLIDYQPKLPEVVKDRYLHTNSTTGNLEWSEVGGDVPVQSDWGQTDSTKLDFIKNKPTKLSDFTNDEGFVDNTVNNLTDYYLKTEIYTQTETDNLLDDKADKATTYTKTEVDGLLDDKADATDVYTKTETDDLLDDKVDDTDIVTSFNVTLSDEKIPSEKLVKDSLDDKADIDDVDLIVDTLNVKKWNQIIKNGNFVDSSEWASNATLSVSNGIATVTNTDASAIALWQPNKPFTLGHKYYVSFEYNVDDVATNFRYTSDTIDGIVRYLTCDGQWHTESYIYDGNNTPSTNQPYFNCNTSAETSFSVKNMFTVDLTDLYGAGNEPTVEEFKKMFPNDYYDYNVGTDINGVVSNLAINKTDLEVLKAKIPNPPTSDGKYFLQVSVDDGVATYSWNTLQWNEA